jgi:hypothetical protein
MGAPKGLLVCEPCGAMAYAKAGLDALWAALSASKYAA